MVLKVDPKQYVAKGTGLHAMIGWLLLIFTKLNLANVYATYAEPKHAESLVSLAVSPAFYDQAV